MGQAQATINLDAIRANWRALDQKSSSETGAVVKADAYGLGIAHIALALAAEGARKFFVAQVEEAMTLRETLGQEPEIYVFSGHMPGDAPIIRDANLIPLLNNIDQVLRHVEALPGYGFGVQLDTGMNRLGIEPAEWRALRPILLDQNPHLIMSHLACSDDPGHPMNGRQLSAFHDMTHGINVPRSLSATGGILLGGAYHFDLTRPGIGLYGGLPFRGAQPVLSLDVPVIQVRDLETGETVGYGNSWSASKPARIATVQSGYADGLLRALSNKGVLYVAGIACPIVGRVSMDMIGVDITALDHNPEQMSIIGHHQNIDVLADAAGTIGYEILTGLGHRYTRRYLGDIE